MPVIKVDNLSKEFDRRVVLDHLTFVVRHGEILGRVNFSSAYTALPSTHVFGGMRLVLQKGITDLTRLAIVFGLNLFYLLLGGIYFGWTLGRVRERGYLSRVQME